MSGYFTNTVMKSSGKLQLIYLLSALAALQLIIAFCTNTLMFTHEEAMWHSALCYEQAGDTSNAMKFFRRIAEGEGFYADAAAMKL